jgi:hypothetical protein
METTPTTGTTNQAWAEAAAASAAQETSNKQEPKPPRCFTEKMACKLSNEDILVIADQIEKADAEACALEDDRKATNDTFKAKIALAEQRRADLIAKVRSKTEMRDVELVEEFLFSTNTVRISRADTKALVRERAMTRAERQEELPLGTKAAKKEDVAKGAERAPASEPPILGTEIEDPQTLLGSAADDGGEEKAKGKRRRRSTS